MTKEQLKKEKFKQEAKEFLKAFKGFDKACEEEEYTDTGDAWDTLYKFEELLKKAIKLM